MYKNTLIPACLIPTIKADIPNKTIKAHSPNTYFIYNNIFNIININSTWFKHKLILMNCSYRPKETRLCESISI